MLTLFCRDRPVERLRGRRCRRTRSASVRSSGTCWRRASICRPRSSSASSRRQPTPTSMSTPTVAASPVVLRRRRIGGPLPGDRGRAAAESQLWASALRPRGRAGRRAGVLTARRGPAVRAWRGDSSTRDTSSTTAARACSPPPDDDVGLLLGDVLLAHGLVPDRRHPAPSPPLPTSLRSSRSARRPGRTGVDGDGAAWAATASLLGQGGLDVARTGASRDPGDATPLERLARAAAGEEVVDAALVAHDAGFRAIV